MNRHEQGPTRPRPKRKLAAPLIALGVASALLTGACSAQGSAGSTSGQVTSARLPELIPQPVVENLVVAPESRRVDVGMPTFSDPTNITNPLFPISSQESVLQLGRVDGKPFRAEVTLLPDPRVIQWQGRQVETLVSQYAAYLDGRLHEVAYDFYAQADDGSVWYFGEDVFNFKNGFMSDTHGTWIAGKDGPAAMIMPGDPKVGDVYRPENMPGFVFEEVTVRSVGQTVDSPVGPVSGAIVIDELHMDGAREAKTFAPGYGEFYIATGGDVEATVLAVPTDAISGAVPAELATLQEGANSVLEATRSRDWKAASTTLQDMTTAWETYRRGQVHTFIESQMSGALETLTHAVDARTAASAGQAAINVGRSSLDLQLPHRPVAEIDVARFDLWLNQLLVDAAAGDAAAVNGDFFTLDYIRDRIQHSVNGADLIRIHAQLEVLYGAVGNEDLAQAAKVSSGLRDTLAEVTLTISGV